MHIKIAIVEDDKIIRDGVVELLRFQKEVITVTPFESAEQFVQEVEALEPDVVLMDIGLPGLSGTDCVQNTKPQHPQMQFLMFTVYNNPEKIFNALRAGATGYILKSDTPAKIMEAVKSIYKGGSPMSPEIARLVVYYFHNPQTAQLNSQLLTNREKEVLQHLSQGFLYKEIAGKMTISTDTVRSFIRKIYEKLQVHNRTEAINKISGK